MTRLTDSHTGSQQTLQQHQQSTLSRQPTLQLSEAQQRLEPTAPAARLTPDTGSNDRLSRDRVLQERPTTVAAGLPVGHVEPGLGGDLPAARQPSGRLGEAWATVFGHTEESQATNMLMDKIKVLQATRDNVDRGEAEATSTSTTTTARTLPAGSLAVNSDGSVRTPGGFSVFNDGGHNWRIREPSGHEHRIWGDPHVDENNDGHDDWHFNRDASFILPDGTKIFCDTSKVGSRGGADVTLSDQLMIQYRDSLASMNVVQGGAASLTTDAQYDRTHGDGQIFVLAEDHRFLDGRTLGDLYDRGGDFVADINQAQRGTVSDLARIALTGAREVVSSASSRHTAIMQDRENAERGMARLPTISQMVTNVYTSQRTQRRGEDEPVEGGEAQRSRLQITPLGRS